MPNFALIGAAGYIAPRHLKAIRATNNTLVAALDPNDSVGIIDSYAPDAHFFTEPERFDRFLDRRRRKGPGQQVDWVSVCSPNYLHDAHIRMALRNQCHVICEKPIVINPWNLDSLQEIEAETGCKVYTVLQLRYHEPLVRLKQQLDEQPNQQPADIILTYVTRRGRWYDISWKGSEEKSGGVAMNIGIHFFDLCIWLFGNVIGYEVHLKAARRMAGMLALERARVRWFLSIDYNDLPQTHRAVGQPAYRSLTIDGQELEFSSGFSDLHTVVYEQALAGKGFTIDDARASIQAVYNIRQAPVLPTPDQLHPMLQNQV